MDGKCWCKSLYRSKFFLLIGADDIGGDDSGTNLQIGTGNGIFTGRGGLVDDKVGVGVDLKAGEKGKFL